MAEIAVWLQLRNNKVRKVSATSLTWVFGRITTGTVIYSTGGTNSTIDTFSSCVESAPTSLTTVIDTQAFTVVQEQLAITGNPPSAADVSSPQLSPFARNSSAAVTTAASGQGLNLAQPGQLQKIVDIEVFDYIKFTGTELPAAGLIFNREDMMGMFTTEPTSAQL